MLCCLCCLWGNVFTGAIAQTPQYTIYEKDGVLFCTGDTEVAVQNNKGAQMIIAGDMEGAIMVLKKGLQHAPLFYPFLYNSGVAYMRCRKYDEARVYLEKAMHVVPENPKIYLLIGEVYSLTGREGDALYYFRKSLQINSKEIDALIKIGNIYIERNQLELSSKYFDAALKIDPKYADAIIGFAKIHFKRGEYYKTLVRLKAIKLDNIITYDKAYHYYYAESAFKLKDYHTAYTQYEQLLQFKNDVFFLTHSYSLIEHKLHLSKQFAELEYTK